MPELIKFFTDSLWITGISIAASVFLIWLMVVGGNRYNREELDKHLQVFGGQVSESHGKPTYFTWLTIGLLLIWTIYYYAVNWMQFAVIFSAQ